MGATGDTPSTPPVNSQRVAVKWWPIKQCEAWSGFAGLNVQSMNFTFRGRRPGIHTDREAVSLGIAPSKMQSRNVRFWQSTFRRPVKIVFVIVMLSCSAPHEMFPVTVAICALGVMCPVFVASGKKNSGISPSRLPGSVTAPPVLNRYGSHWLPVHRRLATMSAADHHTGAVQQRVVDDPVSRVRHPTLSQRHVVCGVADRTRPPRRLRGAGRPAGR